MTYTLAISDTIEFPVKLTLNDKGIKKEFSLRLQAQRVTADSITASYAENGELKLGEFHALACRQNLTGWTDQRLVIDAEGKPAPFSAEALDCLLTLPGASSVIYDAYMQALVSAGGTAGRAKN